MPTQTNNLIFLKEKDIKKTGEVLADAFEHDPIWENILSSCSLKQRSDWFQSPVRYCMKYGKAMISSPEIEGFIGWLPSEFAEMSFIRMLKSGALRSGSKAGYKARVRMMPLRILDKDRKRNMGNRPHIYVMVVGVSQKFQNKGFGGKLLRQVIAKSEESGLPIYLETGTTENVSMYEHLGFKVIDKINIPKLNLPQWELIREPKQ